MKHEKLIWGLIYVGTFLVSAVIGAVGITALTTGDGGYTKVKWNDSVGTVVSDLRYDEGEYNKYDLYLPADISKDHYGLFVYIHGGGFSSGDKTGDADILKWATSKGYVACGIDYTLNNETSVSNLYRMSTEIRQGVEAAVKEAENRGYHIDKMTIGGGSAGSLLAMVYAFRDADISPVPVAFCFQAAGPTLADPREFGVCTEFDSEEGKAAALDFFNNFAGLNVKEEDLKDNGWMEEAKKVSPALLVNENTVPIVFCHGKEDHIVFYIQAEHLLEKLDQYHVPYDFIQFEKSGHNLGWQKKKSIEYMDKLSEYLATYMPVE